MTERDFFPPQKVEARTGPNVFQHAGLQSDGPFSNQETVLNDQQESKELKLDILSHHLYEQLLDAHVSCICVGLPAEYTTVVKSQIANKQNVDTKYLILGKTAALRTSCSKEIDKFMESYLLLLLSFKKQLEDHYLATAADAVAAYCELEMAFQELTGTSSSLQTTSWNDDLELSTDDFVERVDGTYADEKMNIEGESSLFHQVREELKMELKQGYRASITSIREEILRKRKAGKLLGDTNILKQWWNAHSRWPYPTEEEKRELVKTSGLELRQINNWFINHRKRNWSVRSSADVESSAGKKRKSAHESASGLDEQDFTVLD